MNPQKTSKRIIVTGATGFVGKILVKRLFKNHKKDEVLFLVWNKNTRLERGGRKVIENAGVEMLKVDLTDPKTLNNIPKKPKIIIHLAAQTDTSSPDHKVNDIGTKKSIQSDWTS